MWANKVKFLSAMAITFTVVGSAIAQSANQVHLLEDQALKLLSADSEIQALKAQWPVYFKHPVLRDHAGVQTLIYDEVYAEPLENGHHREWEIVGSDIRFHFNQNKNNVSVQKHLANLQLLDKNSVRSSKLISNDTLIEILSKNLTLRKALDGSDFVVRYRLWPTATKIIPALWIEVKQKALAVAGGRIVVVDARTGQVLQNSSRHHYDEPSKLPTILIRNGKSNNAHTYKLGEDDDISEKIKNDYKRYCQLISGKKNSEGTPIIVNPAQCELVYDGKVFSKTADDSSKRAQSNAKIILDFYATQLQQWGLDFDPTLAAEKRRPIVDIVHIGEHFDNAYWDDELQVMVYGDGEGGTKKNATGDYTLALDISGHEYTHGLVAQTAKFAANDEPGALNEAFADIFGILIDRKTTNYKAGWAIGKMLYTNQDGDSDEVALRSLSNPHKYFTDADNKIPFPAKYSEKLVTQGECNDDNDLCEVHGNSTIWSHGAYLIDQGFQEKLNLPAADADLKVAQLYFLTLTHRLHENETMKSAAQQLIQACDQTLDAKACQVVRVAMTAIELL